MKIKFDKENKVKTEHSVIVTSEKDFVLVFKSTDCYVDTNLSRVIVTCKKFRVKERKAKKDDVI